MNELKTIFLSTFCIVGAAYIAFHVILQLIYPALTYVPPNAPYQTSKIISKIGPNNEIAIASYFSPGAKKTILFSHGNAANLATIAFFLEFLAEHGFNVISYDYPGYGLSSGKPNAQATNKAIMQVYDHITTELAISPDDLIIWGRSLGGGPSIYLLSQKPAAGAIIESTFSTLHQVMTHWKLTPFDPYPNDALIKKIKVPILLIHGMQDTLIGPHHAKTLARNCQNCTLWLSQSSGHNDILLVEKADYMKKILGFIDSIYANKDTKGPDHKLSD